MPKLMIRVIMCLGAFLLSTAPISQTFAQVKQQQEAQASGIAVADTLSNSSATESDNLQLLRPGATAIFPVADSIPVADSAAAMPAAPLSTGGIVVIAVVAVIVFLALLVVLVCAGEGGGESC